MTESPTEFDVVIVGAGAAGLAALRGLDRTGRRVLCLEALGRIGGRVYTVHDPLAAVPIELGAEFIHGRPPEIWDIIRSGSLTAYDCGEQALHILDGKVRGNSDAWLLSEGVLNDMRQAAVQGPDKSFEDFLVQSSHSREAKQLAKSYVEGFNAARAEIVSIASLATDAAAADEIDGDRAFRIVNGYDSLITRLGAGVENLPGKLKLNSVVERIEWQPGKAVVHSRSRDTSHVEMFACRAVLITVSIGVLQAESGSTGAILFKPEPAGVLKGARILKLGQVIRLICRFREAFWENNPHFAEAGFLLSNERHFPTWWTTLPIRTPVLTGWSAGPRTDELLDREPAGIVLAALSDLARITGTTTDILANELEATYLHSWHADPFFRGAYSYVPVGAAHAREDLARSVENTLFFAGEATETNGHGATVHGAIASGRRAALEISKALR